MRRGMSNSGAVAAGLAALSPLNMSMPDSPDTTPETRLTLVYAAGVAGGCLFYAWDRLGDRLPFFRHKETD